VTASGPSHRLPPDEEPSEAFHLINAAPIPQSQASLARERKIMDGCDMHRGGEIHLGRVIAVSACQTVALLERSDSAARLAGNLPLEMGTLVKMHTRVSIVYGMVTALRVPLPTLEPSDKDLRLAELDLIGEITDGTIGTFQRGVSAHPALDEPVYLASAADLTQVYARPKVATTQIGTIHQDSAVPAYILIDELFGKHFSIVGTTGSGKSCCIATILGAVIEHSPKAHVIVLIPTTNMPAHWVDALRYSALRTACICLIGCLTSRK
jgi:hypothetical protein